jgi:hypothetical protein
MMMINARAIAFYLNDMLNAFCASRLALLLAWEEIT